MKKATKKLILLLLVFAFLTGCGGNSKKSNSRTNNSQNDISNSSHGDMSESVLSTDASGDDSIITDVSNDDSSDDVSSDNNTSNGNSQDITTDLPKVMDLMQGVTPNAPSINTNTSKGNDAYRNYATELFIKSLSKSGENTLIAPLSVIYALGLTANGATGQTLDQMEEVFGLSVSELNDYLYSYSQKLTSDTTTKFSIANSIWIRDTHASGIKNDFLQKNANYYDATAKALDFNGNEAADEINNWVKEKTDGMIPEIIDDEISETTVMYLINALCFDALWSQPYDEYSVRKGDFTTAQGTKQTVDFMYSDNGMYITDENAKGFIKMYKGGKYGFATLLPDENMDINEYVKSLTGEKLENILTSKTHTPIKTSIPKFETEHSLSLKDALKAMGITDAFTQEVANLDGISESIPLFVSDVVHKTFISVGERGTKAGAVTAVVAAEKSAPSDEIKYIYLNRPFVYMIVDLENNIPIFMGTLMSVE